MGRRNICNGIGRLRQVGGIFIMASVPSDGQEEYLHWGYVTETGRRNIHNGLRRLRQVGAIFIMASGDSDE